MKGLVRALVISALLLLGAVAAPPAVADNPQTTAPGAPVYLALGDSWPAGVGASPPDEGYVPQLHKELQDRLDCLPASAEQALEGCKHLHLVNLAEGGATITGEIVRGDGRPGPALDPEQLDPALALLGDHNRDPKPGNDVEVVTLHIGGNDVTGPILNACLGGVTPVCLQTITNELTAYREDLGPVLSKLRAAGGPDTAIVIGTYDNPIPTCNLAASPGAIALADIVLEGGFLIPEDAGLHDVMHQVAAAQEPDVLVASVVGQLRGIAADWVGGNDCLHPSNSGYDKVTNAFVAALGLS
jgi:lysophospholipase L1-like esterase